jgi:hypothetical protein
MQRGVMMTLKSNDWTPLRSIRKLVNKNAKKPSKDCTPLETIPLPQEVRKNLDTLRFST